MRNKTILTIIKVNIILAAGVLVSIAFLSVPNIYSWFFSRATANVNIGTVATSSILSDIKIQEINPDSIELTKSSEIPDNPVIFFSVEGQAADYLSPVNPIKLDEGSASVYIEPKVTMQQYLDLLQDSSDISGTIKVKYLNEFINEGIPVTLTRQYLMDLFVKETSSDKESVDGDTDLNPVLADLITYISQYGNWGDEQEKKMQTMSIQASQNENISGISKLSMTDEQIKVADAVIPDLRLYIDTLYNKAEELAAVNGVKDVEIVDMDREIRELEGIINTLEGIVDNLEVDKNELEYKVEELIGMLDRADAELSGKDREFNNLLEEIRILRQADNEKRQRIEEMAKELDELKDQIEQEQQPVVNSGDNLNTNSD